MTMDPQLVDILISIRDGVNKIGENQQKQMQEQLLIAQRVQSQDEKLESVSQDLSSLTMFKRPYTPDLKEDHHEGTDQSWTQESQTSATSQTLYALTDMSLSQTTGSMDDIKMVITAEMEKQTKSVNVLLEEERYFLKEQLETAQLDILDQLRKIQQQPSFLQENASEERKGEKSQRVQQSGPSPESQASVAVAAQTGSSRCSCQEHKVEFEATCKDLETSIRGIVSGQLIWLDNEVKTQMSASNDKIAEVVDEIRDLDKKITTKITETATEILHSVTWLSQKQEECLAKVSDEVKEIKSSIADISRTITEASKTTASLLAEQQTSNEGFIITFTEEMKEDLTKACDYIKQTQENILNITTKIAPEITEITALNQIFCRQIENKMDDLNKIQNDTFDQKLHNLNKNFGETMNQLELKLRAKLTEKITDGVTEISHNVTCLSQQQRECLGVACDEVVKEIKSSITDLSRTIVEASKNTAATIVDQQTQKTERLFSTWTQEIKADITKASDHIKQTHKAELDNTAQTLASDIVGKISQTVDDCQKKTSQQIDTKNKEFLTKLYRSKLEIFYFVEKESQLIRNGQQSAATVPVRKKYICDFFVDDFKSLIKSGEHVHSYLWYIDQLKTSVQGYVRFLSSGDMKVWLVHGRHPREVGLEPRSVGDLKVVAAVTDLKGTVAKHTVGEVTVRVNENGILGNGDWGRTIGTVSCQTLLDLGFASQEDYDRGAILVRYEIEIL